MSCASIERRKERPMIATRRVMHRCCLAVTCALIVSVAVSSSAAQAAPPLEFSVLDARPLKAVIDQLESRYGWIITYEDPPYENTAALDDVTLDVAKDPKNFKGKVL